MTEILSPREMYKRIVEGPQFGLPHKKGAKLHMFTRSAQQLSKIIPRLEEQRHRAEQGKVTLQRIYSHLRGRRHELKSNSALEAWQAYDSSLGQVEQLFHETVGDIRMMSDNIDWAKERMHQKLNRRYETK